MKRIVPMIFAVAVMTGCSSSDNGATTSTARTTTTTGVSVTSTSTSTSSTTSSTTTSSTTTSTTVVSDRAADVEAALLAYFDAYFACGDNPADCVIDFAAEEGSAKENLTEFVAELVARGWYFAPGDFGSRIVVEDITLSTPTVSIVTSCFYDAGQVLGPNGPDGQPTVVNDEVLSRRVRHTLFLENGRWLVGLVEELAILGTGDRCAD